MIAVHGCWKRILTDADILRTCQVRELIHRNTATFLASVLTALQRQHSFAQDKDTGSHPSVDSGQLPRP